MGICYQKQVTPPPPPPTPVLVIREIELTRSHPLFTTESLHAKVKPPTPELKHHIVHIYKHSLSKSEKTPLDEIIY